MKNNTATIEKSTTPAFKVKQAMVGLALDQTDNRLLNYVGFFCTKVPVRKVQFTHILSDIVIETEYYSPPWEVLIEDNAIKKAEERIERETLGLKIGGKTTFTQKAREGNVLEEMIKQCEITESELMIVGRKSEDEYSQILAKNLSRKIDGNVLMVPDDSKTSISKILVPIDYSENSANALKAAVGICKSLNYPAKVICVHVYNMPNFASLRTSSPFKQFKEIVEQNHRDGFEAFLNTNAPDYKDQIEVALIEKERPGYASYIYDYAIKNEIDFMVMGRRGHSPTHLLLMGSVAESLIDRNTTIPTLIVK